MTDDTKAQTTSHTPGLISAAPDLLAACEAEERLAASDIGETFISSDLAFWFKEAFPAEFGALLLPMYRDDVASRVIRVRRAAIAKAKGGAQ